MTMELGLIRLDSSVDVIMMGLDSVEAPFGTKMIAITSSLRRSTDRHLFAAGGRVKSYKQCILFGLIPGMASGGVFHSQPRSETQSQALTVGGVTTQWAVLHCRVSVSELIDQHALNGHYCTRPIRFTLCHLRLHHLPLLRWLHFDRKFNSFLSVRPPVTSHDIS